MLHELQKDPLSQHRKQNNGAEEVAGLHINKPDGQRLLGMCKGPLEGKSEIRKQETG